MQKPSEATDVSLLVKVSVLSANFLCQDIYEVNDREEAKNRAAQR